MLKNNCVFEALAVSFGLYGMLPVALSEQDYVYTLRILHIDIVMTYVCQLLDSLHSLSHGIVNIRHTAE